MKLTKDHLCSLRGKMKKINYKMENDFNGPLTPCPYNKQHMGNIIMVGGYFCRNCEHWYVPENHKKEFKDQFLYVNRRRFIFCYHDEDCD